MWLFLLNITLSNSPGNISFGIWIQSLCAAGSRAAYSGGYQVITFPKIIDSALFQPDYFLLKKKVVQKSYNFYPVDHKTKIENMNGSLDYLMAALRLKSARCGNCS